MARALGTAYVNVRGKSDRLKGDLDGAHKTVMSSAKKMAIGIGVVGVAVAAIGLAVKRLAGDWVRLANEQEAVQKRLASVVKATGQSAGLTSDQMFEMAASMQKITTVGDETIIAGMAILATFKTIREEGFERTTMAALDMSEVMQQDLRSSLVMIGKALNDPIANLSAMTRAGVQFSKAQKDTIKSLWQMGDAAGAQNIILKELESQFGGAARAAKDTYGGALKSLGNTYGDLKEELGFAITKNELFIEIVKDTEKALINLLPKIKSIVGAFQEWSKAMAGPTLDEQIRSAQAALDKLTMAQERASEKEQRIFERRQRMFKSFGGRPGPSGSTTLNIVENQQIEKARQYLDYLKDIKNIKRVSDQYTSITSSVGSVPETTETLVATGAFVGDMNAHVKEWKEYNKQLERTAAWKAKIYAFDAIAMGDTDMFMGLQEANERLVETFEETYNDIEGLTERTAWAMQENFSNVFYDAVTGKLKTFGDYARSIFESVSQAWADMMGQMLAQSIFGKDFQGGGAADSLLEFLGGLVGVGGGSTVGAGSSSLISSSGAFPIQPRAAGGPVYPGGTYLVGERGPEYLSMGSNRGNITPGNEVGGNTTVNVTIHAFDSKDVQQAFADNKEFLGGLIGGQMMRNQSLRTNVKMASR